MLSAAYRLKLEDICSRIKAHTEVGLDDIIWAEKLAKANRSAATILRQARREAINPNMCEGGLDDFMNKMDLGDPDPSKHKTGFDSVDDIVDWFRRDDQDDWRTRD